MSALSDYISLSKAAKIAPGEPEPSTIWRWCRNGIRARNGERILLYHIRAGSRLFTKAEFMENFFEAIADADREHFDAIADAECNVSQSPSLSDSQRQAAIEAAEKELEDMGF